MDNFKKSMGYPAHEYLDMGRKQLKDYSEDDVRANHGVLRRLDKRWRNEVVKSDRMPHGFRVTKREHDEYIKQLGESEFKKARHGKATYNGAKMVVR